MADRHLEAAAVVLAGGASSRMGVAKSFLQLRGRSLIERVLERLEPQVARTYVNPRWDDKRFADLGRAMALEPSSWRGMGPIAGIAAAMARARDEGFRYLVTAPCDAPFLPGDLVARLMAPITAGTARAAVAVSPSGWEPLFAIWPVDSLALLEKALDEGCASPRGLLAGLDAGEVRFAPAHGCDPFANLNTRKEFAAAEAALSTCQELVAAEAALARIPAIAPLRAGDRNTGESD